jgi:serine/threonine protein kinase
MDRDILGEQYQLQELIGRGGMTTVYRGQDLRTDRVVALKVLRDVYSADPKFVTRFQLLARTMASLQHPNIVQVYDDGQTDGAYFIVMELVEGPNLPGYLRSCWTTYTRNIGSSSLPSKTMRRYGSPKTKVR